MSNSAEAAAKLPLQSSAQSAFVDPAPSRLLLRQGWQLCLLSACSCPQLPICLAPPRLPFSLLVCSSHPLSSHSSILTTTMTTAAQMALAVECFRVSTRAGLTQGHHSCSAVASRVPRFQIQGLQSPHGLQSRGGKVSSREVSGILRGHPLTKASWCCGSHATYSTTGSVLLGGSGTVLGT